MSKRSTLQLGLKPKRRYRGFFGRSLNQTGMVPSFRAPNGVYGIPFYIFLRSFFIIIFLRSLVVPITFAVTSSNQTPNITPEINLAGYTVHTKAAHLRSHQLLPAWQRGVVDQTWNGRLECMPRAQIFH